MCIGVNAAGALAMIKGYVIKLPFIMVDQSTPHTGARIMRGGGSSGSALSPIAVIVAVAAPIMIVMAGIWPRADQALAVMVSPTTPAAHAMQVIADAGGVFVAATALDSILIARSPSPDFVARLFAAGAWVVITAPAGCEPHPTATAALTLSKD
jgi:hypothetical protein